MVGYKGTCGRTVALRAVQAMYTNAKSSVRVNSQYSPWFDIQVGVHQVSVFSSLLFIIVIEVLSHHFWTGCSWELPCAKSLLKRNPDFKFKKYRGEVSNATIPDIDPVNINGEEIRKFQVILLRW